MENTNMERRKQFILVAAENFYKKFAILHDISLEEFKKQSLDLYLDSNYTDREILDQFTKLIIEKREQEEREEEELNTDTEPMSRERVIDLSVELWHHQKGSLHNVSLESLKDEMKQKFLPLHYDIFELAEPVADELREYSERLDATRKNLITDVVTTYYKTYEFLQKKYELSDLIVYALGKYMDAKCEDKDIVDALADEVEKLRTEYEDKHDENNVQKNHELIYSSLDRLITVLNEEKVDYYLAGALCGYIKYNEESKRTHDDIDIIINEKDLNKIYSIATKMHMGLRAIDKRFDSPRVLKGGIPFGVHEVMIKDPEGDFHIGMFPFERKLNGDMVVKGYYKDQANIACCREEKINSSFVPLIYETAEFNGKPINITAPEYIYILKGYTNNDKDKEDIKFLESRIDVEKLEKIRNNKNSNISIEYVSLTSRRKEQRDDELNSMLEEPKPVVKEGESTSKEKPKTFVKTNPDAPSTSSSNDTNNSVNNKGVVSVFSVTMTILVITAMVLVTMILLTIVK